MSVAIEIKNLTKKYEDKIAVNGLTLEIQQGEFFGLLGPNGAGKSTAMRLMYGASEITHGELYVLGLNVKKNLIEIKRRVGIVPQEDGLDIEFSVLENLMIYASYFSVPTRKAEDRSMELLRLMRLEEYMNRSVETLSGGMKRRLTMARALINDPELLFLDEPTTGLDPQARLWLWDFLRKLKGNGKTMVLTTHYMEEAEALCDRVAIIDHGKLLSLGRPQDLIQEHIGKEVVDFEVEPQDLNYYMNRIRSLGFIYQVIQNKVIIMVQPNQDSSEILKAISSSKIQIRKPTLNDVFLKLAGYQLRDEA